MEAFKGHVPVAGGALYAEAEGQGLPLVLIHAGIANLRMWDETVAALRDHYSIIRYDTRAFGLSRTESVEFSNREDLRSVLDFFKVDKAVICGCSRGGNIALDFALEHPHRVHALSLVASGIGGFNFVDAPEERPVFEAMERAWEQAEWEHLADLEMEAFVIGFYRTLAEMDFSLVERFRPMSRLNMGRKGDGDPHPIPLEPPAALRLAEVRVPVQVVMGQFDTRGTNQMCEALVAGIAGARSLVLPTAHLPSVEAPEQFNAALIDFLKSVS